MRTWCCKLGIKIAELLRASLLPAVILFVFLTNQAFCGVSTDGLAFLKIKPSARGTSLGDCFVSIANDANAIYYNPAGLTQLKNIEISLMHMSYVAETSYESGAIFFPIGKKANLPAGRCRSLC